MRLRERERTGNCCLVAVTTQTCIDFQFQYSHSSQHTGTTQREVRVSNTACLLVPLYSRNCPTKCLFFNKLASEEAGQTSLEKAGQRVGGGRGLVCLSLWRLVMLYSGTVMWEH